MKYREMGRTGWQISEVSLGGAYLMEVTPNVPKKVRMKW